MDMDANIFLGGNEAGAVNSGLAGQRSGQPSGLMPVGVAAAIMDPHFVPVIDALLDDQGSIRGVIAKEGHTNDSFPEIIGKAPPGAFVHLYDGVELIGRVSVGESGNWSYVPLFPMIDGRHEVSILVESPDGSTSDYSEPYVIHVDSRAPDIPGINSIVDDAGWTSSMITPEGVTDDNRPTVNGTAEASSTIIVYDKGEEIGRALADGEGNWRFTPEVPLEDGKHSLSFVAVDSSGNLSECSGSFGFWVDARATGIDPNFIPVIDALLDDHGSIRGVIAKEGYTNDSFPEIIGKAPPGAFVHLYDGLELIGRVSVGESGNWSYVPLFPMVDGRHEVSILIEGSDGSTSDFSAPYVIHVDKIPPEMPSIESVVDDEGRITGVISSEGITDDNRPTVSGTAEPNSTIVVYDKGKEIGRVLVDGEGEWHFTPEVPLKDGEHQLSFMAVDFAGNGSEISESFDFQVDTRAVKIRIFGADDDMGNDIGTVFSGGATDDTTPTLWGSATVGGLVRIYENGVLLGETVADVDGTWEFTPGVALSKDTYKFHATVSFDFKGESAPSAPFILTIKSDALSARGIEPASGGEGDGHALVAAESESRFAVSGLSQVLVQAEDELFATVAPSSGGDVATHDMAAYHLQGASFDQLALREFALESY